MEAERRDLMGEQIVLLFYHHDGKDRVGDVLRFQERDGRIAGFSYYYFCPETLADVAQEFGLAARSNGAIRRLPPFRLASRRGAISAMRV